MTGFDIDLIGRGLAATAAAALLLGTMQPRARRLPNALAAAALNLRRDAGSLEARLKGEIAPAAPDDPGSLQSRIRNAAFTSAPAFRIDTNSSEPDSAYMLDEESLAETMRDWRFRDTSTQRTATMLQSSLKLAKKNQDRTRIAELEDQLLRLGPVSVPAGSQQPSKRAAQTPEGTAQPGSGAEQGLPGAVDVVVEPGGGGQEDTRV